VQSFGSIDFISYGSGTDDCLINFEKKRQTFEISFPVLKKSNLTIIDLLKLPNNLCNELSKFPNFESGYLVFKSNNDIKYMEVNYFIKIFLLKILEGIS